MAETVHKDHGVISDDGLETRKWYAWNDIMPPKPDFFHVIGEVKVRNPGIIALLCPPESPDLNVDIISLDLILVQQPGNWTMNTTWAQARYDSMILKNLYKTVLIRYEGEQIAEITVEIATL